MATAVVVAARTLAAAVQVHAEALAGYWSTNKAAETAFVSLDDVLAEWNLDHPKGGELVLEGAGDLEDALDDEG